MPSDSARLTTGVSSMNQYIVFSIWYEQYIVEAPTWVRAVQQVISAHPDTFSDQWTAQDLSDYNPKVRQRLINESVKL